MSIDPIGKGSGAGAIVPGAASSSAGVGPAEPFQVKPPAAAAEAQAVSPLDRLKAGEIEVPQYLDLRVEQATSHLEGKVSSERLSFIRETLRAQLETDPMLVELVAKATGSAFEKPSHGG